MSDLLPTDMKFYHFRDPCIHCGMPIEQVAAGPCTGDRTKAVPIAYKSTEVRWDGVEGFLIRMSDGRVIERHNHISEHAPYYHFGWSDTLQHPPRWDETLKPQDITP